jgi:hypothetical protein
MTDNDGTLRNSSLNHIVQLDEDKDRLLEGGDSVNKESRNTAPKNSSTNSGIESEVFKKQLFKFFSSMFNRGAVEVLHSVPSFHFRAGAA